MVEGVALGSDIVVGYDGDDTVLVRAAAYAQAEASRRGEARWRIGGAGGSGSVRIVIETAGEGERFTIDTVETPDGPRVTIAASSRSVVMAAVGFFLRRMCEYGDSVTVSRQRFECAPQLSLRGHVIANHKQTNTYDLWTLAQWEECLTELAALGSNLVVVYPAQPCRWWGALPFDETPWFDSPEREQEWGRQFEIQRALPGLCHELGIRYGMYLSPNDIWPAQLAAHPDWAPNSKAFACAHVPEARAAIRSLRARMFRELPAIDVLFIPSKDDGGCPGCAKCHPWVDTYLELVEEQVEDVRALHPDCRIWVSQQGLSAAETARLAEWAAVKTRPYLEAVVYGPFSEAMLASSPRNDPLAGMGAASGQEFAAWSDSRWRGPDQLAALLKGAVPVVLYPDICHAWQAQYAITGGDVSVRYVWQRQDAPVPRIRDSIEQFARTSQCVGGAAPYSEGDTDDVNKFAWSLLAWEPHRSAESIAREYARWYFGSGCEDCGEILLDTEEALHSTLPSLALDRAAAALTRLEGGNHLASWRWDMLAYGVRLLEHIGDVNARDSELVASLQYWLAAWMDDPELAPGVADSADFVLRALEVARPRVSILEELASSLRADHALRMRSSSRVQLSYHGYDVLARRLQELAHELARDGGATAWRDTHSRIRDLVQGAAERRWGCQGTQLIPDVPEFPWEVGATYWNRP